MARADKFQWYRRMPSFHHGIIDLVYVIIAVLLVLALLAIAGWVMSLT